MFKTNASALALLLLVLNTACSQVQMEFYPPTKATQTKKEKAGEPQMQFHPEGNVAEYARHGTLIEEPYTNPVKPQTRHPQAEDNGLTGTRTNHGLPASNLNRGGHRTTYVGIPENMRWQGFQDLVILPTALGEDLKPTGAAPNYTKVAVEFMRGLAAFGKRVRVVTPALKIGFKQDPTPEGPQSADAMIAYGKTSGHRFVMQMQILELETHVVIAPPSMASTRGSYGLWRVQGEIKAITTIVDSEVGETMHRFKSHMLSDWSSFTKPNEDEILAAHQNIIEKCVGLRDEGRFNALFPIPAEIVEHDKSGRRLRVEYPANIKPYTYMRMTRRYRVVSDDRESMSYGFAGYPITISPKRVDGELWYALADHSKFEDFPIGRLLSPLPTDKESLSGKRRAARKEAIRKQRLAAQKARKSIK